MKVLVTGASGFIGSHLATSLLEAGHETVCMVRPDTDISHLEKEIHVVVGDITDTNALHKATEGVEVVYHLAAIPNWQGEMADEDYHQVNVKGTQLLLEASRVNGVRKFVFTSSLEAVGPSQNGQPVDEVTSARPRNIYGVSKHQAENIIREFCEKDLIDASIVRLPMIYGPRNMLHLKRYFKMANTGFYPLVGDGSALMEFCYVKNAVHGLILAAEKGKSGEVYFISDLRSYSLKEVVEAIGVGLDVKVRFLKMPVPMALTLGLSIEVLSKFLRFYPFIFAGTGRPAFSRSSVKWMSESLLYCDISKAKSELGYEAPYSLEQGIQENIQWYRSIGAL
jgi:nucleoside-diphosphate-sugar epimerase